MSEPSDSDPHRRYSAVETRFSRSESPESSEKSPSLAVDGSFAPLLLVGGLQTQIPEAGDYKFLMDIFDRVPAEVQNIGAMSRYVGYETATYGSQALLFVGIEVQRIVEIPAGMLAWRLSDSQLQVFVPKNGEIRRAWVCPISWRWRQRTDGPESKIDTGVALGQGGTPESIHEYELGVSQGRFQGTGEFRMELPSSWCQGKLPKVCDFTVFTNHYVTIDGTAPDDEIYLVDYSEEWPAKYEAMAKWLRQCFGHHFEYSIEHIGSTAIPGMRAKPIIDIAVEVDDIDRAKSIIVPRMNSPLWECWSSGRSALTFIKRERFGGRRSHHVHLCDAGPEARKRRIFRDYLRTHPEVAADYQVLKAKLVQVHEERTRGRPTRPIDREIYTEAKGRFVQEILRRAKGNSS